MLHSIFTRLLKNYTSDNSIIQILYSELEKHYTGKGRYYHTLQHLQYMYAQLQSVKSEIEDWDTLLFSLFYHDIIYNATANDNEEKSAAAGAERLQQLNYPQAKIQLCVQQILATKSHTVSNDSDTNLFTDADLSILGADWPAYEAYTKAIRKEYAIYPDLLYKPGRRKVLQHFLAMEKIFKTAHFYELYDKQARENIQAELLSLT